MTQLKQMITNLPKMVRLHKGWLMESEYELKLASGKTVVWSGKDGVNAAERYVDCNRGEVVIAWRDYPRYGIFLGIRNIIEP